MLQLYNDIPIGKENAITRAALAQRWSMDDRTVRRRIAALRAFDNGDEYIIVSHSRGGVRGYYRTKNVDEIKHYFNETKKRAINTFKPLKKMRRVLNAVNQS